ncbi:UNVERIFIED_CONTAM: putative mitochondrial protein [Sesamum indicum]
MLTNDTWTLRFPSVFYQSLTPRTSDHSPMVVNGDNQQRFGGMFRFDNFLTLSPDFIPSVQSIWQQQIVGVPMFSNRGEIKGIFLTMLSWQGGSWSRPKCCTAVGLCMLRRPNLERIMQQKRAKMEWMKGDDQCSRVFFRKIAQRRTARRIMQINDAQGITITEPNAVIHEFISYYQSLLGGDRRQRVMDLRFLRPWARHIITTEEAGHLLEPFSAEDIKKAVFDIGKDRAPGPDGTILTVIPKVHSPTSVADFRPIFCCNILYKIIPKLIVQKLSVILDKIISPCQAAFVPGRSIGDNVMLAQELFTGYNQARLPPRCALNVDIRKAYETVEWNFLLSVPQLFGFPKTFSRWVEECISSPSFSVGMNGKPHGYFAGARGLRQGDPLSPYLFVLVMEVLHMGILQLIEQDMNFAFHWKCDDLRIFQLGFADDLLLFCRANTASVRVFKSGLDRFADWSGLRLNVEKSHIIISRSAQNIREELLAVLGFQEGHLPMRYLGLPLISSRLSIADCQPLLSKIDTQINGWEGLALSYAGRVQIIKAVLVAMGVYWASAFILPKGVIKNIEKRLRAILWRGTGNSGYPKVAWKEICKPMEEGGLGLKDMGTLNRALMCKKLYEVIRCDRTSIWVEWLRHGRLRDDSIWAIPENRGPWGWKKMLRLRGWLRSVVEYRIGDGSDFFLWKDPWHHLGPLLDRFPRGPNSLGLHESTMLCSVICEGHWHWPLITDMECVEITHVLPRIHGGTDRIIWKGSSGKPTTQDVYRAMIPAGPKVGWISLLSGSLKIPRHLFILWLAILEKLATTDKPWLSHLGGCVLCNEDMVESHNHLFFHCRFSRRCLSSIRRIVRFQWPNRDWVSDVEWGARKWRGKHIINISYRCLLGSCVYHIWRERNLRRFEHEERPPSVVANFIVEDVRQRILSIKLPSSISTCALYRLWRIPWPVEGSA